MRSLILAIDFLIGLCDLAGAQAGSIEVRDAWARATAGSAPGGAFMTIVKGGASDDPPDRRIIAHRQNVTIKVQKAGAMSGMKMN
jgi:hypothetical protein